MRPLSLHSEAVSTFGSVVPLSLRRQQVETTPNKKSLARASVVHGSALMLWKALEQFQVFSVIFVRRR